MARCLDGFADAFSRLDPDAVVLLGDRYEMLAVASAAAVMHIPIVHIAGGEISEGAVDDSIRHAITKLATFHLTATEPYRRRVIQMGEEPDRVAMSSAKKDEYRFSSCLHVRKFVFGFFHRAKPVSSKNRGFFELALWS